MADDKFTDDDKADESTPEESTADLADGAARGDEGAARGGDDATGEAAELSEDAEIVDPLDTDEDEYVDDPATEDINEAKLDRATDEVAGEGVTDEVTAGSTRTRSTRPVKKSEKTDTDLEPAGKKKAARTRTDAEIAGAGAGRVGPVAFVGESAAELKKVVWPTGTEVREYFVVVLVFVLFIMAIVMGLDLLYGWAILKVFG